VAQRREGAGVCQRGYTTYGMFEKNTMFSIFSIHRQVSSCGHLFWGTDT
jgi:hypothetical protein